jgi:aspartate/methionine/tyrosine aminotransferase
LTSAYLASQLNNPNNPTGQLIPTQTLLSIIDLVKKHAAPECVIMWCVVFMLPLEKDRTDRSRPLACSDEVYRPLFHDDVEEIPASILELGYPHAVATGSLSKAYSLAGLRVGWLASNDRKITDAAYLVRFSFALAYFLRDPLFPYLTGSDPSIFLQRRDYNIISVATIDDHLASLALSPTTRSKIVNRNVALTSTNRRLVEAWVAAQEGRITWVAPNAGTTAILHLGEGVDDETFCERLQQETGVVRGALFDVLCSPWLSL